MIRTTCTLSVRPAPLAGLISAAALLALVAAANAQPMFAAQPALATALRPGGVAIGDFNLDGRADVAVSVDGADNIDRVLVFHGAGAPGSFAAPVAVLLGNNIGPGALAAGDFDGDGDTDLVVAQQNQASLRLVINSAGTLALGGLFPTGANPRGLVAMDLDGDGDPDLATANRDGNTVTILRNNSSIFGTAQTVAGALEPRAVAFADFNGDMVLDLVFSNHDARTLTVIMAVAPMTFTGATTTLSVGAGNRPDGVAAGDVTGDGLADIVTAVGDTPNAILVFRGQAGGTFAPPTTVLTGGVNPGKVVLADLDKDGDLDVVTANEDSANLAVLINNGAGAFGAPLLLATGATPTDIAVGDLDAGIMPDLVVPNRDSNTTSVFLNTTPPPPPPCPTDFNGDGTLNADDLSDFITCYFQAAIPPGMCDGSDFNADGQVNADDLSDFITAYFTGCP